MLACDGIDDILALNGDIVSQLCASINVKSDIAPIRSYYCFNTKQPWKLAILLRAIESIDEETWLCSGTGDACQRSTAVRNSSYKINESLILIMVPSTV